MRSVFVPLVARRGKALGWDELRAPGRTAKAALRCKSAVGDRLRCFFRSSSLFPTEGVLDVQISSGNSQQTRTGQ